MWEQAPTLDVTASFLGITTPVRELYDEIHKRGWTVKKVDIKDGQYSGKAENPHGEAIEASGNTDKTAVGNLLLKIMRREHMRSAAQVKVGMWDTTFEDRVQEIAQAYADAPLYDPKAAPAWVELAQDCTRRAEVLQSQLEVEIVDDPAPYKTANEMRKDVQEKQHIFVTRANPDHPVWSMDQMVAFRLVHDVLGHCVAGGDWGWHGENLACAAHFPLLSETAQRALFTEALGQTAFGQTFRQWGPQKIAFLDDVFEEDQGKSNKPGHTPVHPSQSVAPSKLPHVGIESKTGNHMVPVDPNHGWESGVSPLPDNGFMWQRDQTTGVDPLHAEGVMENARLLDPGLANLHPAAAKQAVANAFRATLMAPRKSLMNGAIHYQDLHSIPAEVDDPVAYWDALEARREAQNQSQGMPPEAHRLYWPELQQFKQWVKATNPRIDDREVTLTAKRELLHMLQEEEERMLAEDKGEMMPAEEIEAGAAMNLQKRLKTLTKPKLDQKFDFGDTHLWHQARIGGYGSYLASHLRPVAEVSKNADYLANAAQEDLRNHRGTGHHFRAATLGLGIPGVGPKQASLAWMHLSPQTSQLAVLNPQTMEALGRNYEELSDRDYFKHERELTAGRDASGYNHIPLGPFTWGLYDHMTGGPGYHQDNSAMRVVSPVPHSVIDWDSKIPPMSNWSEPYWWASTAPARDQVATDFDQRIGVNFPKGDVPFQPRTVRLAGTGRVPWFIHPQSGEVIEGMPGMSLMQHIRQLLGTDATGVWDTELEAGKR